jgi:hypothetical protein
MIKRLLVQICFFMFLPTYSFIYQAQILQRWDSHYQYYQTIIGLGDFHDKKHPSTGQQRQYLEHVLNACDKHNTHVVVEDLSSTNCHGCHGCGPFILNSRAGILGGLTDSCRRLCLSVTNLEYRYCRVVALGPIFNNHDMPIHTFQSARAVPLEALYREIMREINEILTYRDGMTLERYYRQCIDPILTSVKQIHLDVHKKMTVADYLTTYATTSKIRSQLLNRLLTFDSALFDCKVIHAINQASDKKTIIVVAGGTHINHMTCILNMIGYKHIFTSKLVVSSHCQNSTEIRPEAIDLGMIARYLP